jgi:hypothetical protein
VNVVGDAGTCLCFGGDSRETRVRQEDLLEMLLDIHNAQDVLVLIRLYFADQIKRISFVETASLELSLLARYNRCEYVLEMGKLRCPLRMFPSQATDPADSAPK